MISPRRLRRGLPVRVKTSRGPLYAVVYDRQLPRERERELVYVRVVLDHPLARKGRRLHVSLTRVSPRMPRAHAVPRPRRLRRYFGRRTGACSTNLRMA